MTSNTGALRVAMVSAQAVPAMGGIETHVHEVSRRLADSGLDVTVLTTDRSGALARVETVAGYQVRRWSAYPRSRDYYFSPGLIRYLAGAQGEFDVVHVQGVHTLVPPMALAAAWRAHIPSVMTFHTGGHSSGFRHGLRSLQWKAIGPALRTATALVAVCDYERRTFARTLGVPESGIRLIRNGCESLPIDDTAPGLGGSPSLISVGRLEEYKGHHRILQAMPEILSRAPEAKLALIGRGPFENSLREMARELGVERQVLIRGFGPHERGSLGKMVADADVVCLLSEYEAHPVAVMEAIGTGVKALVADTSGMTELGRAGLVTTIPLDTPPHEVAATALKLAAAPRNTPAQLPTWDDCARQLDELYREVTR